MIVVPTDRRHRRGRRYWPRDIRSKNKMLVLNKRNHFSVSPSSFGFLWDECPRCYYNEVRLGQKRSRTPAFPAVFSAINRAMKQRLDDGNWHVLGSPQSTIMVESQGKSVRSSPITQVGRDISLQIRGSYDSVVVYQDGTRAICDFKTSPIKPEYLLKYGRQLHAYAYALENPEQTRSSPRFFLRCLRCKREAFGRLSATSSQPFCEKTLRGWCETTRAPNSLNLSKAKLPRQRLTTHCASLFGSSLT